MTTTGIQPTGAAPRLVPSPGMNRPSCRPVDRLWLLRRPVLGRGRQFHHIWTKVFHEQPLRPVPLPPALDGCSSPTGRWARCCRPRTPAMEDFQGHEGCNEVLNVTRPDIVRRIHEAYLAVGRRRHRDEHVRGELSNLGEYGIADRIEELALAGARLARDAADAWSSEEQPRFVLGSMGPGTKLPSSGHAPYRALRDAYQSAGRRAMLAAGSTPCSSRPRRTCCRPRPRWSGARRALARRRRGPAGARPGDRRDDRHDAARQRDRRRADRTGAARHRRDRPELRHRAHRDERAPAAPGQARPGARSPRMPNAGLPQLSRDGAYYPLTPEQLADRARAVRHRVRPGAGRRVLRHDAGAPRPRRRGRPRAARWRRAGRDRSPASRACTSTCRSGRTRRTCRSASGPTPTARRRSGGAAGQATGTSASRSPARRPATARTCSTCASTTSAATGPTTCASSCHRLATSSTLPLMLDSTEPAVIEAGLELLGGRAVVNSVNYEDGDGPGSRFARIMPWSASTGPPWSRSRIDEQGQARTAERKVAVADRHRSTSLIGEWGMDAGDIVVDTPDLPDRHRSGGDPPRRARDASRRSGEIKRRYPDVQTTLGLSNVSFGLSPAARVVLNSVFLHECVKAGLDSAIVHAAKILPMSKIDDEQRQVALDLVYDRRRWSDDAHDPLRVRPAAALPRAVRGRRRGVVARVPGRGAGGAAARGAAASGGSSTASARGSRRTSTRPWPGPRGARHHQREPARRHAGRRRPVRQRRDAAAVRAAVRRGDEGGGRAPRAVHRGQWGRRRRGKAKIVLATVKGDVHDIGKNLVDIILTNNGYDGLQPRHQAADQRDPRARPRSTAPTPSA